MWVDVRVSLLGGLLYGCALIWLCSGVLGVAGAVTGTVTGAVTVVVLGLDSDVALRVVASSTCVVHTHPVCWHRRR